MAEITCRDFERMWNEQIDERSSLFRELAPEEAQRPTRFERRSDAAAASGAQALLDHAAVCRTCGQTILGYQRLARALGAWGPAPSAPAGLLDRILDALPANAVPCSLTGTRIPSTRRLWRVRLPIAATVAAIAVGIVICLVRAPIIDRPRRVRPAPPRVVVNGEPRAVDGLILSSALADATDATWDLARSASEPASRLGRDVYETATNPEQTPVPFAIQARPVADVPVPSLSLDLLAHDSAAAVATFQQVGVHLASSVRPLSSSARQAFGFLLGPSHTKIEAPARAPSAKGA
jgi:hypothetical protein